MVEAVDTAPLRAHVRLLGDMLGKIIRENAGEALFERVEQIRLSSKAAQDSDTWETLDQLLASCLLYTSPSPRDKRQSRMPSSA